MSLFPRTRGHNPRTQQRFFQAEGVTADGASFLLSAHRVSLVFYLQLSHSTRNLGGEVAKSNNSNNKKQSQWDFPGGPVVGKPPCNAGDVSSIPGPVTKIHMPLNN